MFLLVKSPNIVLLLHFAAPNQKMAEVLKKTANEAKDMVSKVGMLYYVVVNHIYYYQTSSCLLTQSYLLALHVGMQEFSQNCQNFSKYFYCKITISVKNNTILIK